MRVVFLAVMAVASASCDRPAAGTAPDNEQVATASKTATSPAGVQPSGSPTARAPAAAEKTSAAVSACLMQGSQRLAVTSRRAVGTEPFWNADIEGRCVTYATPEDTDGSRIWTRYRKEAGGEVWTGAFEGKQFELTIRDQPGCSDGMSDKDYPSAVRLKLGGAVRNGCAAPK